VERCSSELEHSAGRAQEALPEAPAGQRPQRKLGSAPAFFLFLFFQTSPYVARTIERGLVGQGPPGQVDWLVTRPDLFPRAS
jgi:hypothetical protein